MASFNQNTQNTDPLKVNVVEFLKQREINSIINGIRSLRNDVSSLTAGVNQINDNTDDLVDQGEETQRSRNRDRADLERYHTRDRASQNAIRGEISRGNKLAEIGMDLLKGGLRLITDSLKNSLRSIDSMVIELRKSRLSNEEIKKYSIATGQTLLNLSKAGYNVSRDTMNEYIRELVVSGRNIDAMIKEGTLDKYAMARFAGYNEELARQAIYLDDATIKRLTDASYDPALIATIKAVSESIDDSTRAAFNNDPRKLMDAIFVASTSMVKDLGNAMSADQMAKVIVPALKAQSNNLASLATDEIGALLTSVGDTSVSLENLGKAAKSNIKNLSSEELYVRTQNDLTKGLMSAVLNTSQAINAGQTTGVTLKSQSQISQSKSDYSENGLLQQRSDEAMAYIDVSTGALSEMSVSLNKYFGTQLTMEQVVTGGFTMVIDLLKGVTGGISNMLSGALSGILSGSIVRSTGPLLIKLGAVVGKLGVVGLAIGSVGLAVSKIKDTFDKQRNEEVAQKEYSASFADEEKFKALLKSAQDSGNAALVNKYKAELDNIARNRPQLEESLKKAQYENLNKTQQEWWDANEVSAKNKAAWSSELELLNIAKRNGTTSEADEARIQELTNKIEYENRVMGEWQNQSRSLDAYLASQLGISYGREFIEFKLKVKDALSGIIDSIKETLLEQLEKLKLKFISDINDIVNFASSIAETVVVDFLSPIKDKVVNFVTETIPNKFKELKTTVNNFFRPLKEFFNFKWLPAPIKKFIGISGETNEEYSISDLAGDLAKEAASAVKTGLGNIGNSVKGWWDNWSLFANGGIVNKPTKAIVGEAGKEAVIPLTKPDKMSKVLLSLTPVEKLGLIKALMSKNVTITRDIVSEVLLQILSNRNTGSGIRQLVSSETLIGNSLTDKIIEGAKAQYGKKYSEMVCNQLVEAALKYAGFMPPTTGVVAKHFNHPKMHLVLNDPINGISSTDKNLLPGMIMFSHPFTQTEADQLNRQKGGNRKAGDPGHMGIYAGNGLWWNATSSKNTIDYSSGKGIRVTDSNKGFGVALTKPTSKGTYKLYAAGYYDGMFDSSITSGLSRATSNIPYDSISSESSISSILESAKNAVSIAMGTVIASSNTETRQAVQQYVQQAMSLLNGKNTSEVISSLSIIVKYLRDIASSPSNKKSIPALSRPVSSPY